MLAWWCVQRLWCTCAALLSRVQAFLHIDFKSLSFLWWPSLMYHPCLWFDLDGWGSPDLRPVDVEHPSPGLGGLLMCGGDIIITPSVKEAYIFKSPLIEGLWSMRSHSGLDRLPSKLDKGEILSANVSSSSQGWYIQVNTHIHSYKQFRVTN